MYTHANSGLWLDIWIPKRMKLRYRLLVVDRCFGGQGAVALRLDRHRVSARRHIQEAESPVAIGASARIRRAEIEGLDFAIVVVFAANRELNHADGATAG